LITAYYLGKLLDLNLHVVTAKSCIKHESNAAISFHNAVNMDDAMDDIVRQFKGVTDGLARIVSTPSSETMALLPSSSSNPILLEGEAMARSWNGNETQKQDMLLSHFDATSRSLSDGESNYQDNRVITANTEGRTSGWHSDNETKSDSKGFSSRMNQESESRVLMGASRTFSSPDTLQDPVGMPPEVLSFFFPSSFFSLPFWFFGVMRIPL
jgi:sorting nexin-13